MDRRTLLRGALLMPAATVLTASPTLARPRRPAKAMEVDYPGADWPT